MTIKVSNSEMQVFKSCRRRWWFNYYRELGMKKFEEAPAGPRQLGTKIHVALQGFYDKGIPLEQTIRELYQYDIDWYTRQELPDHVDEVRKEFDLAYMMVTGYQDWVEETGADAGLTLVDTESVIEIPLEDLGHPGYTLRGKLDARFDREVDGARLFLDHKTVQEFTTPPKILPLDEQMKFYHLLEKLDMEYRGVEGQRTDGALYNMLRKVKRTARANPPFYLRLEQRHNQAEIQSMWLRVSKILEEIRDTRRQLDDGADPKYVCPPRPSRDCTWSCDFFRACVMVDDGSNLEGFLEERYEHRDPHERYEEKTSE